MIGWHHNYCVFFGGSNNIFAACSTSAAVCNPQHIDDSSGVDMLEAVKAECLEDGEDSGRENIFVVLNLYIYGKMFFYKISKRYIEIGFTVAFNGNSK